MKKANYLPPAPNFYSFRGELTATRANLPHWNRKNTACFVTFRLFDSLPAEKLQQLEDSRQSWIAAHPQPWESTVAREYFELFNGNIQKWLDNGHGSCLLRDSACRTAVEDALWHFAGERYALYAYVVMPNHVHVLFMPTDENTISDIVASWKRFTAHEINKILSREGTVWQKESFDTLVRSERHFTTIIKYIRENNLNLAWAYNMLNR